MDEKNQRENKKLSRMEMKKQITKRSSFPSLFPGDLEMNGKVNKMIKYSKTPREVAATKVAVKMLIGEIESAANLERTGRVTSPFCIYCEENYDIKVKDTNQHIISECKSNEDDINIKEANEALLHVIEQNGGENCRPKIEVDKTDKTNFIINPASIQVTHLNEGLSEGNLRNCILASHNFLQVIWNRRRQLKRQHAKRETNRSEDQIKMGDRGHPTKGNIGFYLKK